MKHLKSTLAFGKIAVLISIFCFLAAFSFAQSVQDLEAKLKTASAEEKPSILNQLAETYLMTDVNKAIEYAEQAYKASRKADDVNNEAGALITLGDAYKSFKNQKKAIQNYKDAIRIFDQFKQSNSSAYIWNKISEAYLISQSYSDAIDANMKALDLFKKANDKGGIVGVNMDLGDIYTMEKKFESALPYYKEALKMYEDSHDSRGQVTILNRIGTAYSNWGNYDEAYLFLSRALDLAKKNNLSTQANLLQQNIEAVKKNMSNYEKSKTDYAQQKEKQTQEDILAKQKQISNLANENAKSMEEIDKMSVDAQLKELKIKAQTDELMRKKMEADTQAKANELLKKEKELSDAEVDKQRLVIWGAAGFSILVIVLAVFIFVAYRNKKKANDVLKQKNEIIYKQKDQIVQKNILITDSIDYAKNIQDAILPPASALANYFPQSFIYYKPKDIVSGDFYWIHEDEQNVYVAAADCTGHGVPGAFMSLLGFIMIDDIARNVHVNPAAVLKEVNKQLMEVLHQNVENTTGKFGMDVALIKYNKLKKEITYSGAHNPLIIFSNDQLNEIKADKISIGTTTQCDFHDNVVQVKEGDMVYLYSDGFQDQIGGEKRKKFLAFHLKELLQQIHTLSPEQQKAELDKKHNEWRGKTEQTDDILIIGLKI